MRDSCDTPSSFSDVPINNKFEFPVILSFLHSPFIFVKYWKIDIAPVFPLYKGQVHVIRIRHGFLIDRLTAADKHILREGL